MVNNLASFSADVENELVALESELVREIAGGKDKFRGDRVMGFIKMGDRLHVLFGNYQIMHRRGRLDVLESDNARGLKNNLGGDLFLGYFAKNTLSNHE